MPQTRTLLPDQLERSVYPARQKKIRLHIRNRVRCSFGNSINQQEASHVAKRVKVRWSAGRNYRDPNDVVEVPDDATDEEIEKALGGRHGKLEPMVTASAKASDETSIVLARDPRGKLKISIPPAAEAVVPPLTDEAALICRGCSDGEPFSSGMGRRHTIFARR